MLLAVVVPQGSAFADDPLDGDEVNGEQTGGTDDDANDDDANGEGEGDGEGANDDGDDANDDGDGPNGDDQNGNDDENGDGANGDGANGNDDQNDNGNGDEDEVLEILGEATEADTDPFRSIAGIDKCTAAAGVSATIQNVGGLPTSITVLGPQADGVECYVWLSSYRVKDIYDGSGFIENNASNGASPQEEYDWVSVVLTGNSDQRQEVVVPIGSGENELALPACGHFQIDAYLPFTSAPSPSQQIEAAISGDGRLTIVNPRGHDYPRGQLLAGQIYDRELCETRLQLTHMCLYGEQHIWRVQVQESYRPLATELNFEVRVGGGTPFGSGTISGDPVYFTTTGTFNGASVHWSSVDPFSGYAPGSRGTASTSPDICHYEVSFEKEWLSNTTADFLIEIDAPGSDPTSASFTQDTAAPTIKVPVGGSYTVTEVLPDDSPATVIAGASAEGETFDVPDLTTTDA